MNIGVLSVGMLIAASQRCLVKGCSAAYVFDMDANLIFNIITSVASAVTAFFVIGIFFYNRRQQQFDILEQSFDVLQRVNEKALESSDNVLAAVRSANPDDTTGEEEARIIYFHYMRINRIFRAYEYCSGGFITEEQRDRISEPQIRTLVSVVDKLPAILERGYPDDFHDFLIPLVRAAQPAKIIN
ncbi:MAG: hypothetical protein AAGO57_02080 [Pseudomonadota bacterium]